MPTTYTINVKNRSGGDHHYFLFVDAPDVSADPQVFQNVYMSTPNVADQSGTATFTCYADYYAICGTSPHRRLSAKVKVTTAESTPVQICQGPKLGTHCFMTGGSGGTSANFVDSAQTIDCNRPGAYRIDCDNFKANNGANQFIGLGVQDPEDSSNIVPIAVFDAIPGTQNFIQPHPKYYISWGTYTPGQIIDFETIASPAGIDFTGKGNPNATVVHNNDGTWTVNR